MRDTTSNADQMQAAQPALLLLMAKNLLSLFFLTIDSRQQPIFFDNPRLSDGKAYVKYTKVMIKIDLVRGCAALVRCF